ncbi:tetratricopeptide repeat protein [Kitasatospora sp. NPDC088391]|uniref:tetratricopeptide repeat protein n=1 Tax=Kitasatospora sp. NPDC088391 TaxID=3364074 RepID=UPI003805F3AF
MTDRERTAHLAVARVLAHCGGDPAAALGQVAAAVAAAPGAAEPYEVLGRLWAEQRAALAPLLARAGSLSTVLAHAYVRYLEGDPDGAVLALGSVAGARPAVAWAAAPWFADPRVVAEVDAEALAEAALRIGDGGHPLDAPESAEALAPWVAAVEAVAARPPGPEALARFALFLRMCGRAERSLELCDRADAVRPVMLTAVVRAGSRRVLGDLDGAAAAFEQALLLDPANWSLHLDLADLCASRADFAAAVAHAARGLSHAPDELLLRAAHAAYRTALTGDAGAFRHLLELAGELEPGPYRDGLLEYARSADGLPEELRAG